MVSIKVMANKKPKYSGLCSLSFDDVVDINNKECDVHLYLLTYFLKQQEDAEIGDSAQLRELQRITKDLLFHSRGVPKCQR